MRPRHSPAQQVIYIEAQAAAKPAMGAPCNGCGLCCLAEPCPLGVLLSRSRSGPCEALQWNEDLAQYRCGALGKAGTPPRGWSPLRWMLSHFAQLRLRVVLRWIAAGAGCDCDLEPSPSRTISASSPNPSDVSHD